jgi:hypothetical protein
MSCRHTRNSRTVRCRPTGHVTDERGLRQDPKLRRPYQRAQHGCRASARTVPQCGRRSPSGDRAGSGGSLPPRHFVALRSSHIRSRSVRTPSALSFPVPFVSIGLPALPAAASAAGGRGSWALLCSLLFALCSLLSALCSSLSPLFPRRSTLHRYVTPAGRVTFGKQLYCDRGGISG